MELSELIYNSFCSQYGMEYYHDLEPSNLYEKIKERLFQKYSFLKYIFGKVKMKKSSWGGSMTSVFLPTEKSKYEIRIEKSGFGKKGYKCFINFVKIYDRYNVFDKGLRMTIENKDIDNIDVLVSEYISKIPHFKNHIRNRNLNELLDG